jgi:hypothetical protein
MLLPKKALPLHKKLTEVRREKKNLLNAEAVA